METALAILAGILLGAGSLFAVIGGVGILRLPDFFTRMHGAGITDTLGAGLILTGLMIHGGLSLITVKLMMILLLIWVTSPTSTYALARSALTHGLEPRLADEEDAPSSN